ncbi:Unc104-like kinesin, putative [Trypanosoma cruzi marinkellei]|uniref:Unc104-like kinesin, putative n=1 Tax=Trypanosoma cruzi marinkellei TaxID=85056 RepID=K2MZI3_TRYCR|nr:Unc104-like kinesin, putative [Trypanosoma cruzi marinkellei]
MLEVYGESVHDLLAQGERRMIRRRAGPDGTIIMVENLTCCSLMSMGEWKALSEFGMLARRTAPTERNSRSSRSHAIFTIKTRGMRLCLVDLAGSERQTTYSPKLNKESIAINKSLSRLSTVLEALSSARLKSDGSTSYVNFRDTTLTVLLQRYLSGASLTVFLACIHPDTAFYYETMSTMRYTQRLKCINTKNAPKKPSEDMSLFHLGENQKLLEELMMLRSIVGRQQEQQEGYHYYDDEFRKVREEKVTERLPKDHRSDFLYQNHESAPQESAPMTSRSIVGHRQRLLRYKDAMRVAGWLLSRILSELPELSVGFDDYFDTYLPPQVQVVGYISLMTCMAPRDVNEAMGGLAFLDVGDIAMGLSMLDAGIPACVGLHRLTCGECNTWEAHEYDGVNKVFVLAFFEINEHLVEIMGDTHDAFECCGGLLTLEPLVPLAIVLCTPLDASDELKENVLQHLIALQGEQDGALESSIGGSSSLSQLTQMRTGIDGTVKNPKLNLLKAMTQWRDKYVKEVTSSSDSESFSSEPLAEENGRQTLNELQVCSPFQESVSVNSGEAFSNEKTIINCLNNKVHAIYASSSSFSSESSSDSSVILVSKLSLLSPAAADEGQCQEVSRTHLSAECPSKSECDAEKGASMPESIDREIHGANQVEVSVSPADVHVDVYKKPYLPHAPQTIFYSFEESPAYTVTALERSKSDKKDDCADYSATASVPPPAKERIHDKNEKKKKKKYSHRKRKPVLQGCHNCVVL